MSLEFRVIARERLTPTVSTGFTAANIPTTKPGTRFVRIQAIGGQIHYQEDGNAATTAAGNILPEESVVEIWGDDAMQNFRCIDAGGSEELECEYMGTGE